jgi:hypothetical protein
MTVTATITKTYNYSDSIADINDDLARAGEPPMTHRDIEDYVRECISDDGGDGYNAVINISAD